MANLLKMQIAGCRAGWLLRQMWLCYWKMGQIPISGIVYRWESCPLKESPFRRGEGMRCGQTAGSLKSANDLQWRLIAFAINAVALAPAILSAIEVDFRSKKTLPDERGGRTPEKRWLTGGDTFLSYGTRRPPAPCIKIPSRTVRRSRCGR